MPTWAKKRGERAGGEERVGRRLGQNKRKRPAKRRKEEKEKVGRSERGEGEKEECSNFEKGFKYFQFKFKLKDLNLS